MNEIMFGQISMKIIGHVTLVAITGTAIWVPNFKRQATETHLKIALLDFTYGCPIFKGVEETRLHDRAPGPDFCLLLGVSLGYAQPITGQVTEVACPVIGPAQPELTLSKRQKTGSGQQNQQWHASMHVNYSCHTKDYTKVHKKHFRPERVK